jgi:hypothetical protein
VVGEVEAWFERYHDVGLGHQIVGEPDGGLVGSVDACFGQRGQGHIADLVIGVEPGGQYRDLISASLGCEAGGQLGASCVVHGDEKQGWLGVVHDTPVRRRALRCAGSW